MSKIKDFYMDNQGKMPTYITGTGIRGPIEAAEIKDNYDQQMDNLFWEKSTQRNEKMLEAINKPVDSNLKTLAAIGKPKLSDVPPVSLFALGAAMSNGAEKYGRFNWRDTGTTASVFYDAIMRHLVDYYNGESYAHDSKVHHLAHIMASCAILLDSELHGNLNDDRAMKPSVSRNPTWKE
jgi:hypothetical protein